MNVLMRRKRIVEIVTQKKSVLVSELSTLTGASEVTIRTDLKQLEQEGMLLRFYGGATTIDNKLPNKKTVNKYILVDENKDKNKIAERALTYVKDNHTIIIGSGTTNAVLAEKIAVSSIKGLTIITNNLMAMNSLSTNKDIVLIILGGRFTHGNGSIYGKFAEKILESIKADIMFTGADGLDETGVTSRYEGFSLSATLATYTNKLIVITESFKVGKRCINKVLDFDQITKIITTKNVTDKNMNDVFMSKTEMV